MPNVVKGSKQQRMIVVAHRPLRRLSVALAVTALAVAAVLVGGYWGYSGGAGQQEDETQSRAQLARVLETVSSENEELRRALVVARSESEVNSNSAEEVERELSSLQMRIAELESDVQYYRQVVTEQTGSTGLMISRFDLSPSTNPDAKRYKLVLRQQDADGDTYLEGRVAVTLAGRRDGQAARLPLNEVSLEQDEQAIRLRFKYFQNVEGEIVVPEGFEPAKIEVTAVADTPVAKRVDQEFPWDS